MIQALLWYRRYQYLTEWKEGGNESREEIILLLILYNENVISMPVAVSKSISKELLHNYFIFK